QREVGADREQPIGSPAPHCAKLTASSTLGAPGARIDAAMNGAIAAGRPDLATQCLQAGNDRTAEVEADGPHAGRPLADIRSLCDPDTGIGGGDGGHVACEAGAGQEEAPAALSVALHQQAA